MTYISDGEDDSYPCRQCTGNLRPEFQRLPGLPRPPDASKSPRAGGLMSRSLERRRYDYTSCGAIGQVPLITNRLSALVTVWAR